MLSTEIVHCYRIKSTLSSCTLHMQVPWPPHVKSPLYDSLQEHETWTLGDLPPNRKPVGSKWVFKVKYDERGEVNRYKARLVAQGFSHTLGVDFNETFAPVARFGTIRSPLAMDVTTAFLNGNLKEDIYMRQPEGFEEPGHEDQVCHLHKSLYGLKQSPRCWYEQLSTQLEGTGFKQSKADPCLFYKWESGRQTVISIYVDDLILLADLLEEMMKLKHQLSAMFKMTDMGNLSYCLGIQREYLLNIVKQFGLEDAHPVATPANVSVTLEADDGVSKLVDQQNYQQIIGSLLYASGGTRPDVTFIVGVFGKILWEAEPALYIFQQYIQSGMISGRLSGVAGRCERLSECRASRLAAHGRSRLQDEAVSSLAWHAGQQEH